jgi:hypothetical protein
VGYPDVDLDYHHSVNDRDFSLATREIREILGNEVPLSDPDVLAFLRGTLDEGLASLSGD